MAICPNCGSDKFRYQLRQGDTTGYATYKRYTRRTSYFLPVGSKSYVSHKNHVSVGFCPECGYVDEPVSTTPSTTSNLGWIILLCLVVWPVGVMVMCFKFFGWLVSTGKRR